MSRGLEERAEIGRPGLLRRAAAGAWHVPAGFAFLARNPTLWPMAILPLVMAVAFLFLGLVGGAFAVPSLEAVLIPSRERVPHWLSFVLTLALWAGALVAGMVVGLAVALLMAAPALERLSRQVEARVRGQAKELGGSLGWEVAQSLRGALYFLAASPGVFVLSLVPLVGPVLGALWGAHALSFQETDAPLARRGLDFRARREWHRRWRPEALGFGLAGLIGLIVPFANFLVAPALAVGGTLLVLEFEEGLSPTPGRKPSTEAAARQV